MNRLDVKKIGKVIALIALAILYVLCGIKKYHNLSNNVNIEELTILDDETYSGFSEGETLTQSFHTDKNFRGMTMEMAFSAEMESTDYVFRVTDVTHDCLVYERGVSSSEFFNGVPCIQDDEEGKFFEGKFAFYFDKEYAVNEDSEFLLEVVSMGENKGLSFLAGNENVYEEGEATFLGENLPGDFAISLLQNRKDTTVYFLSCMLLLLIPFVFVGLHFVLDVKSYHAFLHKYRYPLVLLLLAFLVCNKVHFSNISSYNTFVQSSTESSFSNPLFGMVRNIRSDEWRVTIPRLLAGQHSSPSYSGSFDIINGVNDSTYAMSGISWSLTALAKPELWLFLIADVEYAFSFFWCFKLLCAFMVGYELTRLITKDARYLSVLGGILLTFNQFFEWWSMAFTYTSALACVVFFYYYFQKEKLWEKLLMAFGLVVATGNFVVQLYPAWQVPNAYITLALMIWVIVISFEHIKQINKTDIVIIGGSLLLLVGVLLSFLSEEKLYMERIMSTVYPAGRVITGGFALNQMFYYFQSLFYPIWESGNPSEISSLYTLYPMPTVLALYLWMRNKNKKQDLLTILLLVVSGLLTLYCAVPLPSIVAKLLLFTYSMPPRMVICLGLVQVLLLLHVLGTYSRDNYFHPVVGLVLSAANTALAVYVCRQDYPNYLTTKMLLLDAVFTCGITWLLISDFSKWKLSEMKWVGELMKHRRPYRFGIAVLGAVILLTGLRVNPINRTLDSIYSKPVAKAIQEIVKEDGEGVWIAQDNNYLASMMIACGARTLNCTNTAPNYELWEILDPDKKMEEVWNRYAHLNIEITDGDLEAFLSYQDAIELKLPASYLKELNVRYICSNTLLHDTEDVTFTRLYNEGGYMIYRVDY